MARVVVCGYMVRHPVAGNLLAFFHYILGLHRLGHDVVYLEESGWPYSCYNPALGEWQDHPEFGLRIVRGLMARHGLSVPVCYVHRDIGTVDGMTSDGVSDVLRTADVLLNVGGVCWLPEFSLCHRRALIDMDPFFTQTGRFAAKVLKDYHAHFSYGANIGRPGCSIPTAGVDWLPAVPPVVPDLWEGATEPPAGTAFTTVANWTSYGTVTHEGEEYGQKDREFLSLLDLPRRTPQRLELALSNADPETTNRLRAAGWSVRNGGRVSLEVDDYKAYLTGSRGEFSAAKHAYVKSRSGWFSDRSVCYLAAGLPVVLQDTGFSDWLPTGRGVLAFSSPDAAAGCLEDVAANYAAHRRAAREIAASFFDYRVVLPRLLETATAARLPASCAEGGTAR